MIKISGFVAQEDISFVQLTVLEQLNLMVSILKVHNTFTKIINNVPDFIMYLYRLD